MPQQLDVEGLGFRVPLIVVSPYAKHGYVSHVQHEFGSVLKLIEETYNLGSLGTVDVRSDDMNDIFNLTQPVTPLSKLRTNAQAQNNIQRFLRERPSMRQPDDD